MAEIDELKEVVRRLRAPDGCPWDKEQTHATLKATCIEEAAEVVCAINLMEETGSYDSLREELGDLLLQVVMQAEMADELGWFNFEDVARTVKDKMIHRHPHVFGDVHVSGTAEEMAMWDAMKVREKAGKEWMDAHLPEAFDESEQLIERARIRKHIKKQKAAEAEKE